MLDFASSVGQAAVYNARPVAAVVREIMIVLLGIEAGAAPGGGDAYWLQLRATKADSTVLIATVLVDDPRLTPDRTGKTRVLRYIYQEGDQPPIEYVNAVRGGAVTTEFDLLPNFFPSFAADDVKEKLFPDKGNYLGEPMEIRETRRVDAKLPENPLRLELDPELIVGTSRNVRDVDGRRVWTGDDYKYRPFAQTDYDEMIDAGINYFWVNPDQEQWIWRRPVFYLRQPAGKLQYPEIFYRANFRGVTMFMDEPAIYLGWHFEEYPHVAHALGSPAGAARMLEAHVRDTLAGKRQRYDRRQLHRMLQYAFPLGSLIIEENDYPAWETQEWSVYYQLKAGVAGAVHEGRYTSLADVNVINAEYDALIPDTPENNFRIRYAWFRGACRAFGGDWGTAIYGQAEQSITPLAMTAAYDMGARYVWFWTSDRLHHMPYPEQLELTRHLRAHAAKHPRPPLDVLRKTAKTAIVLPDGYPLAAYCLWGSQVFHLDRANPKGVAYRDVLHPAALQIERCVKANIPFDLIYDDGSDAWKKYEEAVVIADDGSARLFREGRPAVEPPMPPRSAEERSWQPPTIRIRPIDDGDGNPLTVRLKADIDNGGEEPGLRSRDWGTDRWTTMKAIWTLHDDPIEPAFAVGETVNHTFAAPGSYKITAWTCNRHGQRGEATTHILVGGN